MNVVLLIVSSFFFLAGFWGLLIPVLPDLPLIFIGVLIYALGTRFAEISVNTTVWLGVLAATAYLVDYLIAALGAKRYGASRLGAMWAVVGGFIGLIMLPPFGFLIGSVLGTLIGELAIGRSLTEATRASKGALLGFLLGLFGKMVIAGIIIGVFLKSIL